MFQNLHYGVKRRILDETEDAFQDHPAFKEKVKVYNKFPYNERVQFGVILRNTAATQIRLSADNFMSDLYSLVKLTRKDNYPGVAIEWVRENVGYITEYITEDVSSQLNPNLRFFTTSNQILAGPDETHCATSPGQVKIKINGIETVADTVNGETGFVLLNRAPNSGSIVTISYHIRNAVLPGIFTVDFIENNQFIIHPTYVVENELLISSTTGLETESTLLNPPLDSGSEDILLCYKDGTLIRSLIKDTEYTIDYNTGLITYLSPLNKNYSIYANYHYSRADIGPYTFKEYQENHVALPGIVISIGRRAEKGDQQIIIVSRHREQQAKIYGGHWEMSLDLSIIAKDPMQMEQMSDQLVNYLWCVRKNILEYEGITLNRVEPTGETEEVHIESTGDQYFESSVSVDLQSEWQSFVPYEVYVKIKSINVVPDLRPVFKGPIMGFEKLT